MTKLALADSPLARRLCQEKRINIDYIETSAMFADTIKNDCPDMPLLLHNSVWDWSLAHNDALNQKEILKHTKNRLKITNAPFFSIHIGFSAGLVEFDNGMQALSPSLNRQELLAIMVKNVLKLKEHLDIPLLLENLDYVPAAAYEHICEPDFISELLAQTDTYLLLDLAHAQVSASRFSMTIEDYLADLPLQRVKQLHISGPREKDNVLFDAHEPLLKRDYKILETVLEKISPWAITLEYKKDEGEILDMLERLKQIAS